MEPKPQIFTYPEEYMVYWEIEAEKIGFNLPYYFAKKIKDISEELGAKVYVGVWWPYAYITLIRELEKEIEECVQKEFEDNSEDGERQCRETCENDEKCVEECMDEMRYNAWRMCEESIVDDLRPKFLDAAKEIESEAEIYGIIAKTHVMFDKEGLKLKIRLEGYSEIVPLDVVKTLLTQVIDAAKTKYFTDLEKLAYYVAKPLLRYYSINTLIKLIQTINKEDIKITKMLDNYDNLRRYEMTIYYNGDEIKLYVTEEKGKNYWLITNIAVGAILSQVPDLTPT